MADENEKKDSKEGEEYSPTPKENLPYTGIKLGTQGVYIKRSGVGRNTLSMTRENYTALFSVSGSTTYAKRMPKYVKDAFEKIDYAEIEENGSVVKTYINSYSLSGDTIVGASMAFRKMEVVDVKNRVSVQKSVKSIIIPK